MKKTGSKNSRDTVPLSDDGAKVHALLINTSEYGAPFQSVGLAESTVL
jgi:hypothetical protein